MPNILIADDDIGLCQLLKEFLSNEAFSVDCVYDGKSAVERIEQGNYDALVLDVMLPKLMGFDVLRYLREQSAIPILMLTARGDDIDRILGLELGADDYLPKPCNPRELVARLRAVLRRSHPADSALSKSPVLNVANVNLSSETRTVTYNGRALALTSAEFNVLHQLMRHAGSVVTKENLTQQSLGRKLTAYDRSIDVHVSKIRKKLSQVDASDELITNIRGIGYQFIKK